jgi:hypothetical protein
MAPHAPQVWSGWSIPLSAWDSSVAATGKVWTSWTDIATTFLLFAGFPFSRFMFQIFQIKTGLPLIFIFF